MKCIEQEMRSVCHEKETAEKCPAVWICVEIASIQAANLAAATVILGVVLVNSDGIWVIRVTLEREWDGMKFFGVRVRYR